MQKKVHRTTKKKGGLTMPNMPNMQQVSKMAAKAKTHLEKVQDLMNSPEAQKVLAHSTVQGHFNTAAGALSSAAQKVQHPAAAAMLNKAASTLGTTLKRGGKRGATKKVKRARKGKKH